MNSYASFRGETTFSNEKVGALDVGVGGKGGVKRKGTRFWEKENETKILYLALLLVLLHLRC